MTAVAAEKEAIGLSNSTPHIQSSSKEPKTLLQEKVEKIANIIPSSSNLEVKTETTKSTCWDSFKTFLFNNRTTIQSVAGILIGGGNITVTSTDNSVCISNTNSTIPADNGNNSSGGANQTASIVINVVGAFLAGIGILIEKYANDEDKKQKIALEKMAAEKEKQNKEEFAATLLEAMKKFVDEKATHNKQNTIEGDLNSDEELNEYALNYFKQIQKVESDKYEEFWSAGMDTIRRGFGPSLELPSTDLPSILHQSDKVISPKEMATLVNTIELKADEIANLKVVPTNESTEEQKDRETKVVEKKTFFDKLWDKLESPPYCSALRYIIVDKQIIGRNGKTYEKEDDALFDNPKAEDAKLIKDDKKNITASIVKNGKKKTIQVKDRGQEEV